MVVFCVKLHFTLRKCATNFLCGNTVSNRVVRHSLAYVSVQKWFTGRPLLCENLAETDLALFKNTDLQSIFSHSASPVIFSEGRSVNTNRKSTRSFGMSLKSLAYVAPKALNNAK